MPADIILYAVIAAGLFLWLRSLLGMRGDDDRRRPNPFAEAEPGRSVRPLPAPQQTVPEAKQGLLPDGSVDTAAGLDRNMSIDEQANPGLMDIVRADKSFNAAHFLKGAQDAFIMIVEAFAAGNRDELRNLLSDQVYTAFDVALSSRERNGETASVEIHSVRRAEIVRAWLAGKTAHITVRFVADETNILRDHDGQILHGNPDRVSETIDVWTFTRDTRSRNPGWFLSETRDEDAGPDHKTVPDA